jgi:L-ascorbate metabolism protein UlaG (beta-lactamase superfamily)
VLRKLAAQIARARKWANQTMQITWFGHSCFRIDTGTSSILIDPFLTGNATFEDTGLTVHGVAKGVTHVALTHGHDDHTGDAVAICKASGATLIAVFELAMHMAGLGVKVDPGNTGGTLITRTSTSASFRLGILLPRWSTGTRSISAPVAAW